MKCLGLVHRVLQRHRVGCKFVVHDVLFLISRINRLEMTSDSEGEVLGKFVVLFDLGRFLMDSVEYVALVQFPAISSCLLVTNSMK